MALIKDIVQVDGIVTRYHRVMSLEITTNERNQISVISYVDDAARMRSNSGGMQYCQIVTYGLPYDDGMTIEKAYEYLKTLPQFDGAEDA